MTTTGSGVLTLLASVEDRVRALLGLDPDEVLEAAAGDPVAGLVLRPADLERRRLGTVDGGLPAGDRLEELALRCDLDAIDLDLLAIALAPHVDPHFERYYGFCNDDVTRRCPTVGLCLALAGLSLTDVAARAHLVDGPLVRHGLLTVRDAERPLPGREVVVADPVVAYLLGAAPPAAAGSAALPLRLAAAADLVRSRLDGPQHVVGDPADCRRVTRAAARDRPVLEVQLQVAPPAEAAGALRGNILSARLCGAVLLVALDDLEAVAEAGALLRNTACVLHARRFGPLPAGLTPGVAVELPPSSPGERAASWRQAGALGEAEAWQLGLAFRLDDEEIAAAVRAAGDGGDLEALRGAARAVHAGDLGRLARRVVPAVGWADLVLPADVEAAVRGLGDRARLRHVVLGEWGLRAGGGRGTGVVALFAGASGTGKTLAAEVLAGELGLDLYVVDLSRVVDKYIGETEKNLERTFTAAERADAVLLFDEADALFGKRSEVSDAHDRNANIEVAYLLQRIESFDGVAILTTNLRANLDEAFSRRLDALVDFPMPDAAHREHIWRRHLRPPVPVDPELDLAAVAGAYELSGGSIAAVAVGAAYRAAAAGGPVRSADVAAAAREEFRKLGRIRVPDLPVRR